MAWAAIDDTADVPRLAVGCARSEYHLCEQVPGMNYAKADGIWRAPLTWQAWVAFLTVWGRQPVEVHPGLREWSLRAWEDVQEMYAMRQALDAADARSEGEPELFPFQRAGAAWLAVGERAGLFDPRGNGKTPQAIRALRMVRQAGMPGPWLVVATPATLYNWRREIGRWAPELSVRVVDGTAQRRRKAIMDEGEADVYVIGWPTVRYHTRLKAYPGQALTRCDEHGGSMGLSAARCEVHEKELNEIRWAGVIADEAHRMKDARSKQTRAVWHVSGTARFFWPMTGTPIADNIADVWPVMHGISHLAFPSKSKYLDLYAVKQLNWHGGSEFLGIKPETENAFHASVQPLFRRIPAEVSRPQMPARLPDTFRYPEMTTAQSRAYRQLEKEALAELEHSDMVTSNSLAKFSRLCQLAAASLEQVDGEDKDGFSKAGYRMAAPSSKADDLLDFLEDNPGPVVVCMNSPQLLALCEQKLALHKVTHCAIKGGQPPVVRDQSVQWFQEGQCRVMLLTARAGGEGITLTASSTVFFLQPEPSWLATDQVIGRVDRIGQARAVRVVYSISRGTVEERLYQLSQDKQGRADAVTRDPELLRWMIAGEAVGSQPQVRNRTVTD